jgi:hypothetical protein
MPEQLFRRAARSSDGPIVWLISRAPDGVSAEWCWKMAQRNQPEKGMGGARWIGLTTLAITLVSAVLTAQGTSVYSLRSSDGAVACLVSHAPDGPQGQAQLAVLVRGPATPTGALLAMLPADLQDFSTLPIRVVLLSAPDGSSTMPRQQWPVALEATLEHPPIDGAASGDGFVRATFPLDWIVSRAEILGERMVVAPNGTRVTSQTRCAITDADAAQWR